MLLYPSVQLHVPILQLLLSRSWIYEVFLLGIDPLLLHLHAVKFIGMSMGSNVNLEIGQNYLITHEPHILHFHSL